MLPVHPAGRDRALPPPTGFSRGLGGGHRVPVGQPEAGNVLGTLLEAARVSHAGLLFLTGFP